MEVLSLSWSWLSSFPTLATGGATVDTPNFGGTTAGKWADPRGGARKLHGGVTKTEGLAATPARGRARGSKAGGPVIRRTGDVVPPAGIEPATPALGEPCSIH